MAVVHSFVLFFYKKKKKIEINQVLVAHACNSSYSGGKDQEDCSSKPSQANSSQDPISKILNTKRAGRVAQGKCPEFKPQYHTYTRKNRLKYSIACSDLCKSQTD
jgi:hypothetical protein